MSGFQRAVLVQNLVGETQQQTRVRSPSMKAFTTPDIDRFAGGLSLSHNEVRYKYRCDGRDEGNENPNACDRKDYCEYLACVRCRYEVTETNCGHGHDGKVGCIERTPAFEINEDGGADRDQRHCHRQKVQRPRIQNCRCERTQKVELVLEKEPHHAVSLIAVVPLLTECPCREACHFRTSAMSK